MCQRTQKNTSTGSNKHNLATKTLNSYHCTCHRTCTSCWNENGCVCFAKISPHRAVNNSPHMQISFDSSVELVRYSVGVSGSVCCVYLRKISYHIFMNMTLQMQGRKPDQIGRTRQNKWSLSLSLSLSLSFSGVSVNATHFYTHKLTWTITRTH